MEGISLGIKRKKRKVKGNIHFESDFHKYMDLRAIIPAAVFALLWSVYITLWVPTGGITQLFVNAVEASFSTAFALFIGEYLRFYS